jgi:DtxR family Mn-dependent transcriptional regulator
MTKQNNSLPQDTDISHSMTHYLLTIHKLKEERGYARVTDIARDLNLTKGSVSTAINNLKKKGLVSEEEDSKFLLLTEIGHEEVHRILSSRTLLFYFLRDFVGVTEEIADKDSCAMEHLVSGQTLEKLFDFMKDLACSKDLTRKFDFNMGLDLCSFDNSKDFIERQKGDSVLK